MSIQVAGNSLRSASKAALASAVFPWRASASAARNFSSPTVRARHEIRTASGTVIVSGTFLRMGGFGSVMIPNAAAERSRKRRARMSAWWFMESPPSRPPRGSMSATAIESGPLASARTFPWGETIIDPPPRCETTM